MKAIKTGKSKFGYYIQFEGDKNFKGCTEAVSGFLSDKLPCEIEITEKEGTGNQERATKVKILGQTANKKNDEFRILIDSGNILQRATELTIAVIGNSEGGNAKEVLEGAVELCVTQFKKIKTELENSL
jgi:hypothetical protein